MTESEAAAAPPPPRGPWVNVALFLATVVSVFWVGASNWSGEEDAPIWKGWTFAVPLLSILLCHEFGHYVLARLHRVDASLPYFIPFPFFLFGTLGAVIKMRGRIGTRNALLDIGAAGPIAGLVVAIPVLCVGLAHSDVAPIRPGGLLEGQAILYVAIKRMVIGPIPDGFDVYLHPTALAGWVGLFITMLNLLPVGQLDGGHVAYALFGEDQDRHSRWLHRLLPVAGVGISCWSVWSHREKGWGALMHAGEGLNWVFFALVLFLIHRGGLRHPPTGPAPLSPGRRVVAWACLALLVLLFMPVPMSQT